MAAKYHVNPQGEVGKCKAHKEECPFGGDDAHFSSPSAARAAYETQMMARQEYRESPLGKLDKRMDNFVNKLRERAVATVEWVDKHPYTLIVGGAVVVGAVAAFVAWKMANGAMSGKSSSTFQGEIVDYRYSNKKHYYEIITPDGSKEWYNGGYGLGKRAAIGTTQEAELWSDGQVGRYTVEEKEALNNFTAPLVGASAGATAGAFSGFLGAYGITRIGQWIDSAWTVRHEKKFPLLA